MSSSDSDSGSSFNFRHYSVKQYEFLPELHPEGTPLIKKKSRIIAAVVDNDVAILRELLDSPQLYNIRDQEGYNLLQIAVYLANKEVFDYLLSIPDFPLDYVSFGTALDVALDCDKVDEPCANEYIACELIKRDAPEAITSLYGNTLLHRVLENSYLEAAKLLIQKGVDLNIANDSGRTPLELALNIDEKDTTEIVLNLLISGAECSSELFEKAVLEYVPFEIQEAFGLYICDKYSKIEVSLYVLLIIANRSPELFSELVKYPIKILDEDNNVCYWFSILCSLNINTLKVIIDKFSKDIRKAYSRASLKTSLFMSGKKFSLENFDFMLESVLKPTIIELISNFEKGEIPRCLSYQKLDESFITELYCYFLSYGLRIGERDLQEIYKYFGYCKIFKMLLRMDVEMGIATVYWRKIMAVFIYDVHMGLESFLASDIRCWGEEELFSYFRHPRLKEKHGHIVQTGHLEEIPRLAEIARNTFRKFFVKKFNIETCETFHVLLDRLPVGTVYKKIITYETKLY